MDSASFLLLYLHNTNHGVDVKLLVVVLLTVDELSLHRGHLLQCLRYEDVFVGGSGLKSVYARDVLLTAWTIVVPNEDPTGWNGWGVVTSLQYGIGSSGR